MKSILFALIFSFTGMVYAITPDQVASQLQMEAGSSFANGRFIIPNEKSYSRHESIYRERKGTLIAVGTFRALVAASYGEFDQVILADLDQDTVDFNIRQIEALKKSEDVYQFLSFIDQDCNDFRYFNCRVYRELLNKKSKSELYVETLIEFAKSDRSASFLKNHDSFLKIRDLARAGRMHSVPANLSGTETYKKLGELLAAEQSQLSVLDVSNAPDYIGRNDENWSQYLENLEQLPWSEDAIVNSTTAQPISGSGVSGWHFIAVPKDIYLAEARAVQRHTLLFYQFTSKLYRNPENLTLNNCDKMLSHPNN